MCCADKSPEIKKHGSRRKKIWELSDSYHCSVLGVCLCAVDLRRIAKRKMFKIDAGASEYEIHSTLVGQVTSRNPSSRAISKLLGKRYRGSLKRYATVSDDEAILELWEQDKQRGTLSGAYWAIITHPQISSDLKRSIYGEIHMLSHCQLADAQQEQRLKEELTNKASMLEEVLVSERQLCMKKEIIKDREIKSLRKEVGENELLAARYKSLTIKHKELKEEFLGTSLAGKLEKLADQLQESNRRNASLCAEIEQLGSDLDESREMFEYASSAVDETEQKNTSLAIDAMALQQEVHSMEAAMLVKMEVSCSCTNCDDQNTTRCPGADLCGKTILYVGGLHKMIPHYKQLVERHGGLFIHHDGGKEVSRNILPKMLSRADVVLCPVDCVSHDACSCVKKICKRYQKPYVMMRSSGLSSLSKSLNDIIQ